jgi:hypothetical protein
VPKGVEAAGAPNGVVAGAPNAPPAPPPLLPFA